MKPQKAHKQVVLKVAINLTRVIRGRHANHFKGIILHLLLKFYSLFFARILRPMGKAWDLTFANLWLKQSGAGEEEEEEVGRREGEMATGKKRHTVGGRQRSWE